MRKHHGVPYIAVDVDRQISGAAANVADHHAHIALGFGEHHFAGCQRVEDKLQHLDAGGFGRIGGYFPRWSLQR